MASLLIGTVPSPVFASFCHVSNISYDYPKQVTPGQSFLTTTTIIGICASDDSYYYSVRVDLNDLSGQVLSYTPAPIGYSNGLSWRVTVLNPVTAPMSVGSWKIQFMVYVFADIASGGTMDSKTIQTVTIQVGSPQSISSVTTVSQAAIPTITVAPTTPLSTILSTQPSTVVSTSSSTVYSTIVAAFGIMLLAAVALLTGQRKAKQTKK
jgi:hypothetical protein